MRFREQLDIINANIDAIKVDYKDINASTSKWVENTFELQEAIRNISVIGAFDSEMDKLNKLGFSLIAAGKISVPQNSTVNYKSIISLIHSKASAIKTSIELSLPEQNQNSITIGFPNFENFSEMQETFSEIRKSTDILFSVKGYQSDVKFQNFDSGTSWVEIALISSAAVGFIGKVLKSLLSLVSQYQGIKANNLALNSMEMDNDIKKTILDGNKRILNHQVNRAIENAFSNDEDLDPEDITKIAKASETLLGLLGKGVTFTPANSQIETIKSDFPSISELMKFQPQKLLEHGVDSSDKETKE